MRTLEEINQWGQGTLPGHLGIRITHVAQGELHAELPIQPHAGTVVSLADTAAGYGCINSLPEGAVNFTTIELKSNHLATARDGTLEAVGKAVHMGRTTQVWDVTVTHRDTGKTVALFRCTQMLIYPK
jgi:1,4-dihydroxy-2-naphthoyl-CoA hydrolase